MPFSLRGVSFRVHLVTLCLFSGLFALNYLHCLTARQTKTLGCIQEASLKNNRPNDHL